MQKFKTLDELKEEFPESKYLVLTDDEANEQAEERIKESLWAFNASFLSDVTGLPKSVFEAIQNNGKCEDNNETMLEIIEATNKDISEVAEEAIRWDGRGHFLSGYDGHEIEAFVEDENETYYIYREN